MTIRAQWFENLVINWSNALDWSRHELNQATAYLKEITEATGAEIAWDTDNDEVLAQDYARLRAMEALKGRLNRYHSRYCGLSRVEAFAASLDDGGAMSLPFLERSEWRPRLDINKADEKALEELPEIGEVLATRIVVYRQNHGPFEDLQDLLKVSGITERILDAIKDLVVVGAPDDARFLSPDMEAFEDDPSFSNYIEWIAVSAGSFQRDRGEHLTTIQYVLKELEDIRDEIVANPSPRGRRLGFTRATEAKALLDVRRRVDQMRGNAASDIAAVTPLFDSSYRRFVEKLLEQAEAEILIIMFFLRFEDERRHPTDGIMEQLVEAHERGVSIRVLLDRDAEGDKYGSRFVNANARKYLEDNGIVVRLDSPEVLTHAKTIIVDSRHVVVGSHNWTAGSFFHYDDTSVYIESNDLAAQLSEVFDELWAAAQ